MSAARERTALVTGATRGLGRAICADLVKRGWRVILTGRRLADAEAAARDLGAGSSVRALALDVGDEASIAAAAAAVSALDLLVNNAGVIGPIGDTAAVDPAEWRRNIEINLIGAMACFAAFWPLLARAPAPTLVNISSGAASNYRRGWGAYCSAKAGLAMFGRALAEEYGEAGLRVFSMRPGLVDTDMQGEIRASGVNEVSRVPRGDLLPAAVPAALVAWLAEARPEDLSGIETDVRDAALRARAGIRLPTD